MVMSLSPLDYWPTLPSPLNYTDIVKLNEVYTKDYFVARVDVGDDKNTVNV